MLAHRAPPSPLNANNNFWNTNTSSFRVVQEFGLGLHDGIPNLE